MLLQIVLVLVANNSHEFTNFVQMSIEDKKDLKTDNTKNKLDMTL